MARRIGLGVRNLRNRCFIRQTEARIRRYAAAMHDSDILSPDDERLLPLVMAMADGTAVDWSAAASDPASPADHAAAAPSLEQLHDLERVIRAHDAARSLPPRQRAAPGHETLLTEMRRKGGQSEHPLRVEWGPLIVHEKIGRGSFGDVYRAWDPRLDREVALKLIPEDVSASAASPVVAEGRLLARVRHPNVMVVHGAERIDGRVGIWTEYIHGETLASEIARRGPLPADEAARIGADVCAALAAVHAASLLHRDVKAQNILRDAAGRIVLGDFGTGIEVADDAGVSDPQIAGTPLYLAPEVIGGAPATIASDLYALGVLLYHLVTGGYPVRGRTLAEIKRAHAAREGTPAHDARPDLPPMLIAIIDTLLTINPEHRYKTAGDVEAALRRWLEQPAAVQSPHRARYVMALAAGAILLTALIVAGVWRNRSESTIPETRGDAAPFALKVGDWILVSEFENETGESVFDGTIRAAVERELEYSDYVRVVQRDRIEDALKLLQQPLASSLNRDLALQLSRRDGGIRAVVSGAIAKADSEYRLTFDVFDAANQTPLTTLSDQARGQSDILAAVRRQTLRIRESFGEPTASIERSRKAQQGSALPSPKALHLFTAARAAVINTQAASSLSTWATSEKIAREIIRDDPMFPDGYHLLAWAMVQQGRREEGVVHAERALRLAGRATPQEQYFIAASVHGFKGRFVEDGQSAAERQELEKAAAAMEALFALQPDHYALRGDLRRVYRVLGRQRDLAWMNLRLADARPWSVVVNIDVANQLLREGNVGGAQRYAARAQSALSPVSSTAEAELAASARLFPAYVAWVQDDPYDTVQTLARVDALAAQLPDTERRQLYLRLASMYAAVGRLQHAEHAIDAARSAAGTDLAGTMLVDMARASLFEDQGDLTGLRGLGATRWRDPLPSTGPALLARRVPFLIEAGLLDAAERDLHWFKQRTAEATAWAPRLPSTGFQPFYASNIAAIELARGRPDAAVTLLRQEMRAIRAAPPPILSAGGSQGQYAASKLAEALEAVGKVSAAISTLEQAVEDRVGVTIGNTPNRWLRTSAQLARLYRRNGHEAKARAIEAHLLKLLAAADADHPLVVELGRRR
jgi:tetratricopeptide (TPR) repeat protein